MAATATRRRLATPGVLIVGGGALAVGAWAGGAHGLAIAMLVLIVAGAIGAYVWAGGSGDTAAVLRATPDERQQLIDLRATAFAALAMIVFCLGGAAVDLARGGTGDPWALICAVGGVAYAVGMGIGRRR